MSISTDLTCFRSRSHSETSRGTRTLTMVLRERDSRYLGCDAVCTGLCKPTFQSNLCQNSRPRFRGPNPWDPEHEDGPSTGRSNIDLQYLDFDNCLCCFPEEGCKISLFCTMTNKCPQLFHKLSHCYMIRHCHVILRQPAINTLPSYTSISNEAVGNTV